MDIKAYVTERDRVLTAAVMKAGVYKAVQEITGISQTVKHLAWNKCLALGFEPTICYE